MPDYLVNIVPSGSSGLLTQADFRYLGYYEIKTDNLDSPFCRGLATRRVGGELRFLFQTISHRIHEVSTAGKTIATSGSPPTCQITTTTRQWDAAPLYALAPFNSTWRQELYWDETGQRMFMNCCWDYPSDEDNLDTKIMTFDLVDNGDDGTIDNEKIFSLSGIPDRMAGTGILPVPASLQSARGWGPYVAGTGSYNSRAAVHPTAMGPSLYAFPDPAALPNGTVITDFQTLAARAFQNPRGVRGTVVGNYFDGGGAGVPGDPDDYNRPTAPPNPAGDWLSPGPEEHTSELQ